MAQNKLERLIKIIYQKWKSENSQVFSVHPAEEDMACFLEGKLSPQETEQIKLHLLSCERCSETLGIQLRLKETEVKMKEIPEELIARAKGLVMPKEKTPFLEIFLRLKENILELLNTTGDILLGQELVPAPVLRSRQIKDFKDEVTILKDFKDIRVQIKIENKGQSYFNLIVVVKEKQTSQCIKDLRITLIRDDLELESYLTEAGRVTFEHVAIGKYTIELLSTEEKLASILLDIKT
jgi:hypothetical protein